MTYKFTKKDLEVMQSDEDYDNQFGLSGTKYYDDLSKEQEKIWIENNWWKWTPRY